MITFPPKAISFSRNSYFQFPTAVHSCTQLYTASITTTYYGIRFTVQYNASMNERICLIIMYFNLTLRYKDIVIVLAHKNRIIIIFA